MAGTHGRGGGGPCHPGLQQDAPGPAGRALPPPRGSLIGHAYTQICVRTTTCPRARPDLPVQAHAHICPRQRLHVHGGPTHAPDAERQALRDA